MKFWRNQKLIVEEHSPARYRVWIVFLRLSGICINAFARQVFQQVPSPYKGSGRPPAEIGLVFPSSDRILFVLLLLVTGRQIGRQARYGLGYLYMVYFFRSYRVRTRQVLSHYNADCWSLLVFFRPWPPSACDQKHMTTTS